MAASSGAWYYKFMKQQCTPNVAECMDVEDRTDEIVIAMDCFRGNQPDSLMVKKLAIYNITTDGSGYYHFFPERSWSDLHHVAREANTFATKYIHNLPYYSGNITYDQLPMILLEHTNRAAVVYAKGCQNTKFLTELIGRPVINIELLMKEMPRDDIIYLKENLPSRMCLDDHRRKHRTTGFDTEFYSCCMDRSYFWGEVVKMYKKRKQDKESAGFEAINSGKSSSGSSSINSENSYYII
jgi:hypothetical protein